MHILKLTMGLLTVLLFANAATAEGTQQGQGDESYLPPASLRAAPQTAPARRTHHASAEPRRFVYAARRHRGYARRGRRFAGRRSFFGIF
jgi:hypothetical protein